MNGAFELLLLVGMVLMGVPMLMMARQYGIAWWKSLISTVLLTVVGLTGTILMFYIETGTFGGASFFGAVFFVPFVFALVALVLRMPYLKVLDLCAVGQCVTMAILRVNCLREGCCGGRVLFGTFRFPSQIAELLVGMGLMVLFVYWSYHKPRLHGWVYPWFMLLYGVIRTGLNLLREEWAERALNGFPKGMIWSLVSIAVGALWLFLAYLYRKKKATSN